MKYFLTILTILVVVGCAIRPEILPDTTKDSMMTLKIKDAIENNKITATSYAWILWYLPILFFAIGWGWKEFFVRRIRKQ